jgi:predicted ester cyclase
MTDSDRERGASMSPIEQQKAAIREFTRVFKNEHNVDGIDHLFAPDFKHNFKVPLAPGLEGFKQVGRTMNSAFPDVRVTEQRLIAADDMVVERTSAAGTHKGPFYGAAPTNTPCNWTEIHMYQFNRDGRIVEHWIEMSMLELLTQVGVVRM